MLTPSKIKCLLLYIIVTQPTAYIHMALICHYSQRATENAINVKERSHLVIYFCTSIQYFFQTRKTATSPHFFILLLKFFLLYDGFLQSFFSTFLGALKMTFCTTLPYHIFYYHKYLKIIIHKDVPLDMLRPSKINCFQLYIIVLQTHIFQKINKKIIISFTVLNIHTQVCENCNTMKEWRD